MDRRSFLKLSAITGAGLMIPRRWTMLPRARIPAGTLDPTIITKYTMPLVIPPAMPPTSVGQVDYYEIAVRQFAQQILPADIPATTVWSYGSINHPETFNYPAFTIEANYHRPVRVKWINGLVDGEGNYLPHLLPVDQTLHWANPPGGVEGRDMRSTFESTPERHTGPVPMVVHLHGGHSTQESDGYAEAWYLPAAGNISPDLASEGTWYVSFKAIAEAAYGQTWDAGTAVFQYDNIQRAGTFWYHDHTLGMTRLNVYAGPAGFYIVRRGPGDLPAGRLPGPAPVVGSDPFGRFLEIPIAIQDRSFNEDGSLFYPDSRAFFDEYAGPFIPETDVSPIWNPEFFGDTIVVNGRTWPSLDVEQRRYRFRFLNGCNSRFLILKLVSDPLESRPATPALPFWQIGTEGGFLPAPVMLDQLLMGLAERADVIVDFTSLPVGTQVYLINEGPDDPFGGGSPGVEFLAADPETTGQVMRFTVVPSTGRDTSRDPAHLTLPSFKPIGPATSIRPVSLHEQASAFTDGPAAAFLGDGNTIKAWDDPITENPALDSTEVWEISNFTEDAHPIHIHEVMFQVVDRQPIGGEARPPESWETGFKDTVIAYPGEITRVKAHFDRPGLFVWHCHIVEHEDNEMMRPYVIGPNPPVA